MSRSRRFSIIGLMLLLAGLLLASSPLQTDTPPTPTPMPTATLTLMEHITVHGFDEQAREWVVRDWGLGLLLLVLFVLGVIGWLVRPYIKTWEERRDERAKTKFDSVIDGDPMAKATSAYLERFDKKYSQFSFRGLEDVSGAKVPEFDTAYISLHLATSRSKQRSLVGKTGHEEMLMGETDISPEIALDEAIRRKHNLAIVGSAGCGKSTLLQWAGVTLARFRLHGEEALNNQEQISLVKALGNQAQLPVFIALRDYVRYCNDPQNQREIYPGSLMDFIHHFYTTELWTSIAFPTGFFKHHLQQGCLLLLDGVDEVSPNQRVKVREAIEGLIDDYGVSANHFLISSRSVAYRGRVEFNDFERLEVQPLNRDQRDQLIRFWCDAIYIKDEASRNAADLSASINRSDERVRQLARTPLMVSIFVLVYYHNRRRLPNQRAEFYYRAARVLVGETHHPSAPVYPFWENLSIETRIDLLKRVAYELYTRGQEDATVDELATWIRDESSLQGSLETAKSFLHAAANRSGLLDERGGQYGFFTHKTFHEFLTGLYVAQSKRKEWRKILSETVRDDQWQEVLMLAAGALAYLNAPDAEEFIDLMSKLGETDSDALRLAGLERAALAQADFPSDRAQGNRETLTQRLEGLIVDVKLPPSQRASLGLALGAIGDPRLHPGGMPPLSDVIPAGHFRMGTNAADEAKLEAQGVEEGNIWEDEKTGGRDLIVEISYDYHIGKYPVTNAEYGAFVAANGYGEMEGEKPPWWSETGWRWRIGLWDTQDFSMYSEDNQRTVREWLARRPKELRRQPFWWDDPKWRVANLPVVGVSWFEAEAYCNWLTEVLHASRELPENRAFRLPSEAEWEKAARGPECLLWPWGDTWDAQKCNNNEPKDKVDQTSPVGMYPHGASQYGALDMAGNVWEWCQDWYDEKAYLKWTGTEVIDPAVPQGSGLRVVRGGSWDLDRYFARCAYRSGDVPDGFLNGFGFRLALSPI